jgi:hypothetical protein
MKAYKLIEDNKYLKITTSYEKGGINWANGQANPRGLYVYFSHIEKSENCESFIMFNDKDFKVLALNLNRYSKKRDLEVSNKIENIKDELLKLFSEDKKSEIFQKIKMEIEK